MRSTHGERKLARILVTGDAGYIGSRTCVALLNAGREIVLFDNFSNSHPEPLNRVQTITGKTMQVVEGDIRDQGAQEETIRRFGCTSVIHFASLKALGELVEKPLAYYDNNVVGTRRLLLAMGNCGIKPLLFNSSVTVYGELQLLPLTEHPPLSAINPYRCTKQVTEDMLRDLYSSDPSWRIGILRYFSPVGAHESGMIGEDPQGISNNLMPFVVQVAIGRRDCLKAWGSDCPTPHRTGVRDYIHVVDLAYGHLKALERLRKPQCFKVNIGTGAGYSVLDVIKAFEKASARPVTYELASRRTGDVASCYAAPVLAAGLAAVACRAESGCYVSRYMALAN